MSIFPTKILLATDGSEEAQLALSTAVDIATTTNSELHIVTVMGGRAYHIEMQEIADKLRQRGRELLDEQVKEIEELGGKVAQAHLRLVVERRDRAIVELAEEMEIGLIVMGNRGLGGVKRALMGSVSDSVVRHAHCPVMMVRWKPVVFPAKILLATDGSEEATLAAQSAADLAGGPAQNCT